MTTHGFCGASRRIEHATAREEECVACSALEHQGPSSPSSSSPPRSQPCFLQGLAGLGSVRPWCGGRGPCRRVADPGSTWRVEGLLVGCEAKRCGLSQLCPKWEGPGDKHQVRGTSLTPSSPGRHDLQRPDLDWYLCRPQKASETFEAAGQCISPVAWEMSPGCTHCLQWGSAWGSSSHICRFPKVSSCGSCLAECPPWRPQKESSEEPVFASMPGY